MPMSLSKTSGWRAFSFQRCAIRREGAQLGEDHVGGEEFPVTRVTDRLPRRMT